MFDNFKILFLLFLVSSPLGQATNWINKVDHGVGLEAMGSVYDNIISRTRTLNIPLELNDNILNDTSSTIVSKIKLDYHDYVSRLLKTLPIQPGSKGNYSLQIRPKRAVFVTSCMIFLGVTTLLSGGVSVWNYFQAKDSEETMIRYQKEIVDSAKDIKKLSDSVNNHNTMIGTIHTSLKGLSSLISEVHKVVQTGDEAIVDYIHHLILITNELTRLREGKFPSLLVPSNYIDDMIQGTPESRLAFKIDDLYFSIKSINLNKLSLKIEVSLPYLKDNNKGDLYKVNNMGYFDNGKWFKLVHPEHVVLMDGIYKELHGDCSYTTNGGVCKSVHFRESCLNNITKCRRVEINGVNKITQSGSKLTLTSTTISHLKRGPEEFPIQPGSYIIDLLKGKETWVNNIPFSISEVDLDQKLIFPSNWISDNTTTDFIVPEINWENKTIIPHDVPWYEEHASKGLSLTLVIIAFLFMFSIIVLLLLRKDNSKRRLQNLELGVVELLNKSGVYPRDNDPESD